MAMGGISDEAGKERAYHIWVRGGGPHGRDFENWVQAQVELEAEHQAGNGNSARKAAPRAAAPKAVKAKAAPAKPARKPATKAKKKS